MGVGGQALGGKGAVMLSDGRKIPVAHLKARWGRAMEKFRRDGQITFLGELYRYLPHVIVDPESFLEDQDAGGRLGRGPGHESPHGGSVRNLELDILP